MNLSDYDFNLPKELIAQEPLKRRDQSRLLVLDRSDGQIHHLYFADIVKIIRPADVIIVNETRVFPARLYGVRSDTGGKVEVLLIKQVVEGRWLAMGKPARALQVGRKITFDDGVLDAEVISRGEDGRFELDFAVKNLTSVLNKIGKIPLPPYIDRLPTAQDEERYQTVFARQQGAIAAPTAGLHFTDVLMNDLRRAGTGIQPILLHVGPGTFEPVRSEDPRFHRIEAEYYEVSSGAAEEINQRRAAGGRAIAVGTTSVRALETAVNDRGIVRDLAGWTEAFIYPPYEFGAVDILITNFHLPKSTLLMLVAAFAGYENMMKAYGEAVRENYRFYSYGDAMIVV